MAASASILSLNHISSTAAAATSSSSSSLSPLSSLKFPSSFPIYSFIKPLISRPTLSHFHHRPLSTLTPLLASTSSASAPAATFHGVCYVVDDNIDTDQIIPAEYLTFVPSNPEEYKKLGSYALIGLPSSYPTRFIHPGQFQSKYSIVIGGDNFGCGSSREHARLALGAAGVPAVVAESYARIFFRNSVATGEIYPLESEKRLCEECRTGDEITIELGDNKLINHTTGQSIS